MLIFDHLETFATLKFELLFQKNPLQVHKGEFWRFFKTRRYKNRYEFIRMYFHEISYSHYEFLTVSNSKISECSGISCEMETTA